MENTIKNWKWNFYAGLIPITAGIVVLISYLVSNANSHSNWNLILAKLDFGLDEVAQHSEHLVPLLKFFAGFTGVNLVIGGVAVMVISYYGLRLGKKWAWKFLLFAFLWVGGLDALSAVLFYKGTGVPLLILPFTLFIIMGIGLLLSYKEVFNRS